VLTAALPPAPSRLATIELNSDGCGLDWTQLEWVDSAVVSHHNPCATPPAVQPQHHRRPPTNDAGLNWIVIGIAPFFSGVPNLDFSGTPLTPKQHFVSATERLWNAQMS